MSDNNKIKASDMGANSDKSAGGWWQTLPGMLTAIAGVITAFAGLLLALHQIGLLGKEAVPPTVNSNASPHTETTSAVTTKSVAATEPPSFGPTATATLTTHVPYEITFPSGTEINFRDHRSFGSYQILAAQIDRRSAGKLGLKLSVRLNNKGSIDVGFWSDSFRLVVDGVPRAPVSWLNDAVGARSAKESDIEFDLPETAKTLALQVLVGDKNETADLPLALQKRTPG